VKGASWDSLVEDGVVLNAANLMIAAGVFVAIIGFLGCCGAIKKSECMLLSYAILIFLIFILEIAAGIYTYTKKEKVQEDLEEHIKKAIKESYKGVSKADVALTKAVDWFQENVECCGTTKPGDWMNSKWYRETREKSKRVPESCCINKNKDCNEGSITDLIKNKKIFTEGCVQAGKNFVKNHMWKVAGVAIGIAVIQLFGIIFAICLCKAIRQNNSGN